MKVPFDVASRLYLKAAQFLDIRDASEDEGACRALVFMNLGDYDTGVVCARLLNRMFLRDACKKGWHDAFWGANFGAPEGCDPEDPFVKYDTEEAKQCRVLMLLFMAAMAESGDLDL